jgi:predicted nucleotidyltransferase component of viral defense system
MTLRIPLANRIKKESHRNIAFAQDLVVEEILKIIPKAVFHGGTCIWRCYSGNRFSEDLDFYLPKNKKNIDLFFENLAKRGFEIKKKKIGERSIYSELFLDRTSVRFEATFQNIKGILLDYEKIDSTFFTIYGLSKEQLINEKINAYLSRRKIRDLYDTFFLFKDIINLDSIKNALEKLTKNYLSPLDENDLRVIIIEGIVPKSNDLIEYIRKKCQNPNI